jgi:hypothetical protein
MQQPQSQPGRPQFNLAAMSTASKILLIAGVLYFIDLFLPWNRACAGPFCVSVNGLHGLGILNLLLVLAIIAMEVLLLANVEVNMGTPQMRLQVEAGLAGGLLLFTVIKILVDLTAIYLFAWLGLVLAIVIAYGGYMRWQESTVATGTGTLPPPGPPGAPPPGGSFTG